MRACSFLRLYDDTTSLEKLSLNLCSFLLSSHDKNVYQFIDISRHQSKMRRGYLFAFSLYHFWLEQSPVLAQGSPLGFNFGEHFNGCCANCSLPSDFRIIWTSAGSERTNELIKDHCENISDLRWWVPLTFLSLTRVPKKTNHCFVRDICHSSAEWWLKMFDMIG